MEFSNILLEKHEAVALIRLNRPKVYNALNNELMNELTSSLEVLEADEAIRAIGKAKTMDLCLTGRTMDAEEAERRLLWSSFASEDRNEGMTAFLEKRQPQWKHR